MKSLFSILLLCVSFQALASDELYRLGVGDLIKVQVYDEPELSLETRVSDSGSIDYPVLGSIALKGRTLREVKQSIHDGLLDGYLVNPNVYVSVVEYRPYFINGEVITSGGYPFHPGLTVNKAITIAGGFTERASKSKIFVSSSDEPDSKPTRVSLLHRIQPGDIITVEESFF